MGASYFTTYGHGKDVEAAFKQATDEALYWHGHGGYSGTIAEVPGCRLFTRAKGCRTSPEALLDAALNCIQYDTYDPKLDRWVKEELSPDAKVSWLKIARAFGERNADAFIDAVVGSKWEPCAAIEVTGKQAVEYKERAGLKGTRNKVFVFGGFASD